MLQKIPNYLTFMRLALIPVFVILMNDPTQTRVYLAIIVFTVAALTDYIDGFLARRFGAVSDFGKLLDPLADKMLVATALIMMLALRTESDGSPWLPAPLVVLIIVREFWVTGIRAVAAKNGVVVAASGGAKVKSGLQMVAIVFLLFQGHQLPLFGLHFPCQFIGKLLLGISIIFSYWAAAEYTFDIFGAPSVDSSERSSQSDSSVAS